MSERVFEAKDESLDDVLAYVEGELESHDCMMKFIMSINVCVEEMFVNVAHYAYDPNTGDCTIKVEFEEDDVIIQLRDTGMEFDPLAKEDPDITAKAEDRGIGGLGIYMVKKTMDKCEYERVDGTNIFTMRKKIKNL